MTVTHSRAGREHEADREVTLPEIPTDLPAIVSKMELP